MWGSVVYFFTTRKGNFAMTVRSVFSGLLVLGGFSVSPVNAQPISPPSPSEQTAAKVTGSIRAQTFQGAFSIAKAEAQRRADLEDEIYATVAAIEAAFPDAFGGVAVEQVPVYRVHIAFSGPFDRARAEGLVRPALRSVVKFDTVQENRKDREAQLAQIADSLRRQKIDFSLAYQPLSDSIEVGTPDAASEAKATIAIPQRWQTRTRMVRGRSDKLKAAPAGLMAGDTVTGGWPLYNISGGSVANYCTFGFNMVDSYGQSAVLSAGHCFDSVSNPNVFTNNRFLALPIIEALTSSNAGYQFDHSLMGTQGMDAGPYVWTENNVEPYRKECSVLGYCTSRFQPGYVNTLAGFTPGYLYVIGLYKQSQTGAGMSACKSGLFTGITCSVIRTQYYSDTFVTNAVQTHASSQYYLVAGGDSGGPVFTAPNTNNQVYALGIIRGGQNLAYPQNTGECLKTSSNVCSMTYIPIDRVNDKTPSTLKIYPSGTVYPG